MRALVLLVTLGVLTIACASSVHATARFGTAVAVLNLPPAVDDVTAHVTPALPGHAIHVITRVGDGNGVQDVTRVTARLSCAGVELDRVVHANERGHGVAHHAWTFRVLVPCAYDVNVTARDGFGSRASESTMVLVEDAPAPTELAQGASAWPPLAIIAGGVLAVTRGARSRT